MNTHAHIDAERMQALLDGELSPDEAAVVRASIESCARCTAEFEAWEMLFGDLEDLPALAPSPTFADRVMEHLPEEGRAGVRGWLGGRAAARAASSHIAGEMLQDYLDERLAARNEARVDRHLDRCAICRGELAEYRAVARSIESLPLFAPAEGFAERVMAELRIREMAEIAMAPTTRMERLVGWVKENLPSSRQSWAAAMGVAVAPVVTILLLVRSVFSHDLVTFSSLASYLRLRTGGWVENGLARLSGLVAEFAPGGLVDGVTWIAGNSTALAGTAALLSLGLMASAWVLYQNLFVPSVRTSGHARLSY